MNEDSDWRRDGWILGLSIVFGALAGTPFNQPWTGMFLAVFAFSVWSLLKARRLATWLTAPSLPLPFTVGVFGSLSDQIASREGRLRAEIEQANASLTLMRDSISALPDAVLVIDENDRIRWANARSATLIDIRYPRDEGVTLHNLLRDSALADYLAAGDYEEPFELTLSGEQAIPLELRVGAFGDQSRVLFLRDLAAFKRLESVRRDFVSSLSHEMRTPLTVISGYLDTLDSLIGEESALLTKVLGQMKGQSKRMENLLRDLMLLSQLEVDGRVGVDEEEPISMCALLDSIVENARAASDSSKVITLDCNGVTGNMLARRVELESICGNIIFNAVKYTRSEGRIEVSLSLTDDHVVFQVADDGIGIDPAHIPRLTERFYRADKSRSIERGGTGLGLAIVKHALHHLQGELEIESFPDQGSTFRCLFPRSRYAHDLLS